VRAKQAVRERACWPRLISKRCGTGWPDAKKTLAELAELRLMIENLTRAQERSSAAGNSGATAIGAGGAVQVAQTLAATHQPALVAARAKIEAGDVEGAREGLATALAGKAKADAEEYRTLGYLESLRSVAAAISAYEKARALDAEDVWTHIFLARLYRDAGRSADARAAASAAKFAAADRRDRSVACDELGDVLSAQSDLAGALTNYSEGLEIRRALAKADVSNMIWARDVCASLWRLAQMDAGVSWAQVAAELESMHARGVLFPADLQFLEQARLRAAGGDAVEPAPPLS
jgi:tetratricopeptide (TPR) repeat protein